MVLNRFARFSCRAFAGGPLDPASGSSADSSAALVFAARGLELPRRPRRSRAAEPSGLRKAYTFAGRGISAAGLAVYKAMRLGAYLRQGSSNG